MRKSHSDAVEITLKKQVSLASIRLRGIVIAPNRKRHSYCDVTTIRQTRRFRFWRRQISNGDAVDLGELGGGRFLPYSRLELVYVVIMYTHRTIVLLWSSGLYDFRVHFNVRRVAYSTD